jgi:hypothetical protein
MRGGDAPGEFAALWWKRVLYPVNQEFLKRCPIEGAARFRPLDQLGSPRSLHGSMDFGRAEKQILRDLRVGRAFVPVGEEFDQDYDVLGFQVHGTRIYSLFANSK